MSFLGSKKVESFFIIFLLAFSLLLTFDISVTKNALASQSEGDAVKLLEGAKKEGEVLLYSTLSVQEGDQLFKGFHEKYPSIKTKMYRASGESILPRIVGEDQAKKYLCDVVSIPALLTDVLKKKNLLAKYLSPQGKFIPEVFKDPDGYWIGGYYMFNVLAYNTKLVAPKDVPRNYEDLLAPKWKGGKIGMDTGAINWFANVLKIMGEEKGLEYMKKLSGQDIKFRDGRALNSQMVAAGEISMTIPVLNHTTDRIKSQGAPIEWVAFEPVIVDINPPAVSAHAPHPNAARLFIDFMLSREGQEIIASIEKLPTRDDVNAGAAGARGKRFKILPYDPSFTDQYAKYAKLYHEVLMKKQSK